MEGPVWTREQILLHLVLCTPLSFNKAAAILNLLCSHGDDPHFLYRRKQREQKQYSKQVQTERLKQKAQDKKRQIDGISKLRKQREKSVGL